MRRNLGALNAIDTFLLVVADARHVIVIAYFACATLTTSTRNVVVSFLFSTCYPNGKCEYVVVIAHFVCVSSR